MNIARRPTNKFKKGHIGFKEDTSKVKKKVRERERESILVFLIFQQSFSFLSSFL